MKLRKTVLLALLTAAALGLFTVELLIPTFPLCPAAKIGLANTVTLFMLSKGKIFTPADCFLVLVARCLISALVTGRLMSVLFSFCGGFLALAAMLLARKILRKGIVAISITGAVFHNIGQTLAGIFFYGVFSVLYMLPAFFAAGMLSGTVTGLCIFLINKNKSFEKFLQNYR